MANSINFSGPLGSCGPEDEPETNVTVNSMYASNTIGSVISVALGGATNIPLPSNQNLGEFVANGTNTIFTVPQTGRYYISYQINTTASVGIGGGARVIRNGSPIPGAILRPTVSVSAFNSDVIANLNAGDTISLQMFSSIILVATLLSIVGSTGAALTIIRLQ